ncbi:MAG: hypothetical protein M3179_03220 [Actinomycetota bacterium]|nr:hypothetical protein [Actinomycetota bacterium]
MTPRARTLCGLVAGVGLLAVLVLMVKPVHATFDDDPLLRLQAFDPPLGSVPTEVDCGSVLSSLRGTSAPASLYTIARDEACHDEGYQRLIAAIAAGCVVLVLSLLLVSASRPDDAGPPPRTRRRYQPTQAKWAGKAAAEQPTEDNSAEDKETAEPAGVTPGDEGR